MQGTTPTFEEVKAELTKRMHDVVMAKKAEREQKRQARDNPSFGSGSTASRDINL